MENLLKSGAIIPVEKIKFASKHAPHILALLSGKSAFALSVNEKTSKHQEVVTVDPQLGALDNGMFSTQGIYDGVLIVLQLAERHYTKTFLKRSI